MSFAARVDDFHFCPLTNGNTPHVGGPVRPPGAATVLIGGKAAARVGDMLSCVGSQDSIATGSATVKIGGKAAARVGDKTAHGGVILTGCFTVKIG